MAEKRELQRVIYFSNPYNKALVEGYFSGIKKKTGKSLTTIYEDVLMEHILTGNKNADLWIKLLYLCEDKENYIYSIADIMDFIFSYYSAGLNMKSRNPNGKPFVLFARDVNQRIVSNYTGDTNRNEFPYFWTKLENLYKYISEHEISDKYGSEGNIGRNDAQNELRIMLDNPDENENLSQLFNRVYEILICLWELMDLGVWSFTYCLLACMSRMQNFGDSPEDRLDLYEVIRQEADNIS